MDDTSLQIGNPFLRQLQFTTDGEVTIPNNYLVNVITLLIIGSEDQHVCLYSGMRTLAHPTFRKLMGGFANVTGARDYGKVCHSQPFFFSFDSCLL